MVDVGAMEVGVIEHILDDLCVPFDIDLFPGLNQGSEHDPIVLVESFDLELKMFERSLPVAHQEIILCLEDLSPIVNQVLVHNQEEI